MFLDIRTNASFFYLFWSNSLKDGKKKRPHETLTNPNSKLLYRRNNINFDNISVSLTFFFELIQNTLFMEVEK